MVLAICYVIWNKRKQQSLGQWLIDVPTFLVNLSSSLPLPFSLFIILPLCLTGVNCFWHVMQAHAGWWWEMKSNFWMGGLKDRGIWVFWERGWGSRGSCCKVKAIWSCFDHLGLSVCACVCARARACLLLHNNYCKHVTEQLWQSFL